MKFELNVEFNVGICSLKLSFKVEVWSWNQSLKLKFETEVWGWKFKRLVCGIILNELFWQIFARTALSRKYLLEQT